MDAEVLAIGTELLLGFTVNSDTVYLGRMLAGLGINCYHQLTVGDNPKRLAQAVQTALARADLVITCGGLGPTVDDVTLETIAQVTGRRLIPNRGILGQIKRRFERLKIRMPKTNIRQAMIPEGAIVFPNPIGTAPGFLLKFPHRRFLVALPGPPAELIPMVEKHLAPFLKRFTGKTIIQSKTLKITGLTESQVDERSQDLLAMKGKVTVGIYAHPAQVDLRITAKAHSLARAKRLIAGVEKKIRRRLTTLIFGADEESLEEVVGQLLKTQRLTIGLAESCTGGLVGHRLTQVPGSSDYFRGGVVAYANQLKESPLGVPKKMLKKYGAVSPQGAQAMAVGIRRLSESDIGLSITGIAGPTGGTKQKPVGLVYIGLHAQGKSRALRFLFSGDRATIKFKASQTALNLLRLYLLSRR